MDKKGLQKLEDEHHRKLRDLERLEMDLDDDFHKFSRETDHLLEALSYACRDSSFASQPNPLAFLPIARTTLTVS